MNRTLAAVLTLALAAPLFAVDVDPKLDRAVRDAVPVCGGATVRYDDLPLQLPARFKGAVARIESKDHSCEDQFVAVLSPSGSFYVGSPWPISEEPGKTIEEKLKSFTWKNLQQNMDVTVERKHTTDGLFKVTLTQTTEAGKMPIEGEVDPEGRIFFFGHFRPATEDVRANRAKAFDSFVAASPAKGAADAPVTILEFSDFQCPSCQRASGYLEPILAKHGDKVRYVRYDLPLTGHAWAFPAAMAGRAVYRQKPDLFWEYKKQVYANQGELNALTFWDWARGFAQDHELDLAKYDADVASPEIRAQLLNGAGTAFSNDIRATPSYMVNGALVEAGRDGAALAAYVDQLLAK